MIELACATDETYAAPTAAMLHSALERLNGRPARIHVLHDGRLPTAILARYDVLAQRMNATCAGIAIDDARLAGFPTEQFHKSCWYRVLLPDLLPDTPRVLYLDSDMIVTDDLAPLWRLPLGDSPFAAVANPIYPFLGHWPRETLGIDDPARYLNSGVLLLNLARLRAEGAIATLRNYASAHPHNRFPEQDALSALYHARFLALHPRWNVQTTFYELPPWALPLHLREVAEALAAPAVVHFIGPFKPWGAECTHPRRALYLRHLRAAGWEAPSHTRRTKPSPELAYYRSRVTWRWRARRTPLTLLSVALRIAHAVRTVAGAPAPPLARQAHP